MWTSPPDAATRPEPLDRMVWPGAILWVRDQDRAWATEAVERDGSLAAWVHRRGDGRALGGRGPAVLTGTPAGARVIRPYLRGGMAAPILGDRYVCLGESRPLREIRVSEKLRSAGVPTPEIVAAAVYHRGAFLRAELVTRYVDRSVTLGNELQSGAAGPDSEDALLATGALVARLARAGLHHPDLHPGNVLIRRNGGRPEAWILDLDRCGFPGSVRPETRLASLRGRLLRALAKWSRRTARAATADLRGALDRGIRNAW